MVKELKQQAEANRGREGAGSRRSREKRRERPSGLNSAPKCKVQPESEMSVKGALSAFTSGR